MPILSPKSFYVYCVLSFLVFVLSNPELEKLRSELLKRLEELKQALKELRERVKRG
ncbi:MAG: hypothetical protein QXO67_04010 [Candidatus Bathyarchaeia archaeon]